MKEAFEKIRERLEKEVFVAELHGGEWNGQTIDNLLCLGNVVNVISEVEAKYGNDWISVEKSLPKEDGWYLVYTKPDKEYKSINKARFIKNYDYHWHGAGGIWRNVAYWMPLPESPI